MVAGILRVALSALMGLTQDEGAQERPPIETKVGVEIVSKYVWRGLVIDNDWAIQPGVDVAWGNWTLSFWGNHEPTDWNRGNYAGSPRGRFTEFDTSLEYGGTWWGGSWRAGAVDYRFPVTG